MTNYAVQPGFYIDGQWIVGGSRDTHPISNPATGEEIASLPLATAEDLDSALESSRIGFVQWRDTAPEERAAILIKAAALIRERAEHLSRIITLEQGKPLAEAKGEVAFSAILLEFHAAEGQRIYGRVLPRPKGTRSLVLQQPIGPVAAFCAWNFPVLNVVRKLAPAIASGCSIIIKPSEETAGSAIEVMRCFQDAGLPGNVAQMVFGIPDMVSRQLLASPITRKLSFTGSVPIGKHLAKLAADTMMRATMELGGHGPVLVFDDCDFEKTLDMLAAGKFRNAGQVCVAPTRFYVQQGIYKRFVEGFAERVKDLRIGAGMDPDTQMGPMANPRRPAAISQLVEDAQSHGARLLAGGTTVDSEQSGFFYSPTVLADVPLEAAAMNEEPFGPLALFHPFATDDDAVAHANRLPFGLAAYCFTENGKRQNMLLDEIEAGMIGVNGLRMSWPDSPFGGVKDSGYGSEDGPEGIAAHLITKSCHVM